ncbi:Protein of unknown function DUF3633 [Cynara cardunculus var. scolymus]|uniref:LIM zinc-binding domain-containing protein n=1 Tax=Cynara cardunculus var. scolymus TaxID=59895 RepID=A0A118K1D8_CYNCS|nr:Protein of unknown function DUF3633 [Cynara cardunculus var. scolymus]
MMVLGINGMWEHTNLSCNLVIMPTIELELPAMSYVFIEHNSSPVYRNINCLLFQEHLPIERFKNWKKDSKAQFYTTVCVMGWLTKILRGFSSSNKNSGKYHGRYENEGIWVDPPTTVVISTSIPSICVGCRAEIGHGRFLSCMGGVWHPECFRCHACNRPISDYEFSMTENRPFHKSCYKERHHPKCDVCKNFYRAHPFWLQKYCPSHEHDGTPRCCSCERMEARDTKYLLLDDGRKLCLECLDSAIMDTHECQPLYLEIQDFYEGLNMKIEQQVPLLLGHHHMPETRGLCLSEEQTISTIIRRPRVGAGRIMDMFTEPYKLVRRCEVTAILILYSLPRLLTGSILAHEMMHAWLRLKGYSNLPPDVEEGICQVLAHMWLDSEIMAGSGSTNVASSSSSAAAPTSSKKGKRSDFEKQLGEFFKHQIESDTSAAYGDGFRDGNKSVLKYGLRSTLDHIRLTGRFPC